MAYKVETFKGPVLRMRCPRCHNRSWFSLAGIQQPSSGVVRVLLACDYVYWHTQRHLRERHDGATKCGHIIAFDGVIS